MTDIIKSIIDWNPWIESWTIPKELLWYKRDIDIVNYLNFKEIKILQWARRTGKSTLLYIVINEIYKKNKNILYLNFDDEILKKYDLQIIIEKFKEQKEVEYLFLDEIQNCKNWTSYIKKSYDTKIFKQIWITWSNSSLIQKEYSSLLTWRNITINIHTLNFGEFLRFKWFKNENTNFLSSEKLTKIKKLFKEYLTFWGFPEVTLRKFNKKELLLNYFDDFIYKDIVWRYNINSTKIKNLALYLLSNNSKLFSYRKLAKTLDLNFESLSNYLNYFYEIYLFFELKKFDYSFKKQLIATKKIYSIDNWFINLWFSFSENIWRILENLVFTELQRRKKEVFYFKQKKECDFVVRKGNKIVEVIQITYSLYDKETKIREIDWLMEAMNNFWLNKWLILTYEEEDNITMEISQKEFKIKILPIWKWLLI